MLLEDSFEDRDIESSKRTFQRMVTVQHMHELQLIQRMTIKQHMYYQQLFQGEKDRTSLNCVFD